MSLTEPLFILPTLRVTAEVFPNRPVLKPVILAFHLPCTAFKNIFYYVCELYSVYVK